MSPACLVDDVDAIDAGVAPLRQLVGDRLGRADDPRVVGERIAEVADGCPLARIGLLEIAHEALHAFDLHLLHRAIGIKDAEIDAEVATDMGK